VFKKDEIIWNCVECGIDETCVQCDACYRKSDHEGHQVYFHRSGSTGLGCCDCGDADAWRGGCSEHCAHNHDHDENESEAAPVELPEDLKRGLRAVLEGAVGVLVSLAICSARGCENMTSGKRMNQFIHWGNEEALRGKTVDLVGRLHNDDVHTYDDVTGALKSVGLSDARAEEKTRLVDEMGTCNVRGRSRSRSQGTHPPTRTRTHPRHY